MERKLSITVIASQSTVDLGIDAAWDEPVLPPLGSAAGQGAEEGLDSARANVEAPRDDAAAE